VAQSESSDAARWGQHGLPALGIFRGRFDEGFRLPIELQAFVYG